MKIAALQVFQFDLPVKGAAYTMSSGALTALDSTLVKLVLDTGHVGWGETCPLGSTYAEAHAAGARAAITEMASGLIGTEAFPQIAHAKMDQILTGHAYAKAAVDIALYDAIGHVLGLPVSSLLGGALTDNVPAYYAIGVLSPEAAADKARQMSGLGYRRLQIKVGGRAPEIDIAVIHAVSQAVRDQDIQIVADANQGWSVRDAITVSQACRNIPLVFEQPCSTISEHRQLRGQLCHPLYLDENIIDLPTMLDVVGAGLADGFGMKLTRMGGLHGFTVMRDICAARSLPHTCDDAWGGDILAAACVHAASTVDPHLLDGVWIAEPYIDGHYDTVNGIRAENGHFKVPHGPGLGVYPDAAKFGSPIASFGAI